MRLNVLPTSDPSAISQKIILTGSGDEQPLIENEPDSPLKIPGITKPVSPLAKLDCKGLVGTFAETAATVVNNASPTLHSHSSINSKLNIQKIVK